jgi:hypothetical protein
MISPELEKEIDFTDVFDVMPTRKTPRRVLRYAHTLILTSLRLL